MGHDVFISYSTKDKLTADATCAILESKGIRCWIAPRDISLGSDWTESVVDAIETARIMVLIFSQNANDSSQIKREVNIGTENGVTIIPIRVEDVMPSKSLKYSIRLTHWLDAFPPPLEQHLDYLADSIHGLLKITPPGKESDDSPPENYSTVEPPTEPLPAAVTPSPELLPPPLPATPPPSSKLLPPLPPVISLPPTPLPVQAAFVAPVDTPVIPPPPRAPSQPPGPPPAKRKRSIVRLIVIAFAWFMLMSISGTLVVSVVCPDAMKNNPPAGSMAQAVSTIYGFFCLAALGISIWLTVIGKLPGTKK